jgi:hypothetical protein
MHPLRGWADVDEMMLCSIPATSAFRLLPDIWTADDLKIDVLYPRVQSGNMHNGGAKTIRNG